VYRVSGWAQSIASWSGLVVEAGVVEDMLGERGAVVDLVEVEVLVLDRLIPALDHTVRFGRDARRGHMDLRASQLRACPFRRAA